MNIQSLHDVGPEIKAQHMSPLVPHAFLSGMLQLEDIKLLAADLWFHFLAPKIPQNKYL